MLRTPPPHRRPVTGQPATPTSKIYAAQFWERLPSPASHRPAARADPAERSHYAIISRDGRKLITIGFALCCHSNATRAPIANPPNSAQLGGIPYHYSKLHPGPCSSVGMRPRTNRQTYRQTDTQMRVTTIHFASSTTCAKCNQGSTVAPWDRTGQPLLCLQSTVADKYRYYRYFITVILHAYKTDAPNKQKVSSHQFRTNLHAYVTSSHSNMTMLLLLGCVRRSNSLGSSSGQINLNRS